jgi:hypothetical protein
VIHDVGPFIWKTAPERIGVHVGAALRSTNRQATAEYLPTIHSVFGALSNAGWSNQTIHSVTLKVGGDYVIHYDPAIGDALNELLVDVGR